jgi:hypothetical protein
VEATLQVLATSLPGEEPFIGDGLESELVANTSDGRIWSFDRTGTPVELGGACVNRPINSNLYSGNYLDLDVTNPDNLPIPVPNPGEVPPGFYREIRILLKFVGVPLTFTTYFDYEVDWGAGVNPSTYANTGALVLVELFSFGPSPKWMGRVVWYREGESTPAD